MNRTEEKVAGISHLKKYFGEKKVLEDINLELSKGENLVVLGKSGSGKSVMIKCMVGLIEPDEGQIMLFGKDLAGLKSKELNEIRKRIGFLFQSAALYDSMTVKENLAFPLRHGGKEQEEVETLIKEVLDNVGLAEAIDKMPVELSGGMRKRVGLARTLILKPEIILYDEPTTGLDTVTAREISQLMLDVQDKYQTSSIIITHDLECARITANRMVVLKDGKFADEGTYQELENSEDGFVKAFFEK